MHIVSLLALLTLSYDIDFEKLSQSDCNICERTPADLYQFIKEFSCRIKEDNRVPNFISA